MTNDDPTHPTYLRQPGDGEGLMPRQASIILHMGVVKAPLCNIMIWRRIKTATCPANRKRASGRRCQKPIALFIDDGHDLALHEGTCDNTPQAISLL